MRFAALAARAGVFLDLDGTLAPIVERPELARPLPEVPAVLRGLIERFALVAVVSGRPGDAVRTLLPVEGLEVFGLYGLEAAGPHDPGRMPEVRLEAERVAAAVTGAWVEDKGRSVAVHYRQAPDPPAAAGALAPALAALAAAHGLRLLFGKLVLELAPGETPGKGAVVAERCRALELRACLYVGDDAADLEAFAALDELRDGGLVTVKVAVASGEAPPGLLEAADLVVPGPAGAVDLLRRLAA